MNVTHEFSPSAVDRPRPSLFTALFNPFYYLAGGKALALGLLVILLASLVASFSHTHFDGVLDFHTGRTAPLWVFITEGLIDWLSLGLVLYLAGLLLSRSHSLRAVDAFGTQALARWPTLVTALLTLVPGFQRAIASLVTAEGTFVPPTRVTPDLVVMIGVMFFSLVMLVWMVALMYRAYAVSCNLKGARAILSFIIGLVLAEAVSKVAVYFLVIGTGVSPNPARAQSTQDQSPWPAPQSVSAPAIQVAESMIDALGRRDFATARRDYAPVMQAALSQAKLEQIWNSLTTQNGPFQKRANSKMEKIQGYDVVFVNTRFERNTLALQVTIDADQKVTGFFVRPEF